MTGHSPPAKIGGDMDAAVQTPQQGPVAAYCFDEGAGTVAEDITGDKHEGTIEGPEWTDRQIRQGPPIRRRRRRMRHRPRLRRTAPTEEFTLEAWVKPERRPNDDPIIFKDALRHRRRLRARHRHLSAATRRPNRRRRRSNRTTSSAPKLETNVWTHLALTYDGAHMRLYVDGTLAGTEAQAEGPPWAEGDLVIGCNPNYTSEVFDGLIDEVRIYNRALGEGELEPNQGPDVTPPAIALSGPLTEGLKEGTKEYALEIHTTDGTIEKRGSGVKNLTVAVDGKVAESLSQKCPETNCGLQHVWTFDQEEYGF